MGRRQAPEGPQFVKYFGPVLDALRSLGGSGTVDEVVERVALDLKISAEEQNVLLPSGQPRFRNQVQWARMYLVYEGLLDKSKRGVWSLTGDGSKTVLNIEQSLRVFLKWAKIFRDKKDAKSDLSGNSTQNAEDATELPSVNDRKDDDDSNTALVILRKIAPSGFERLSQRLLREAGFTQVVVTGKSGDGGIDGYGTLEVNLLVTFKVLFQCKRYTKSVTASQIRDFRGAMQGRADKGIMITTGTFTFDARKEATRDGVPPIELIDGEKLVHLMEKLELGMRPVPSYEVDTLFFKEFEE